MDWIGELMKAGILLALALLGFSFFRLLVSIFTDTPFIFFT